MYIIENKYDRLFNLPKLDAGELTVTQELLAQTIVRRGLLRISDDAACNFINLPLLNGKKSISFSTREVFNKKFVERTKQRIFNNLTIEESKYAEDAVNAKMTFLRKELRKFISIPHEMEFKIARMFVQAAHPAVISNIINEEVKIFISFSHSISDLLGMQSWQHNSNNSGMQSSSAEDIAIYVSCGGNPFIDPEKSEYSGDGFNAMARFMIVAAQEIGHFADINKMQGYGSRFSLNYRSMQADVECNDARNKDIAIVNKIRKKLEKCGLKYLVGLERKVEVQKKYRAFSISVQLMKLYLVIFRNFFRLYCNSRGINIHNYITIKNGLGVDIVECISDYLFNLAPRSDAYRFENKNWETAIACAEALARVPQQEVKWGKDITGYFMPNLQKFYYKKVISAEVKFYEINTGKKFSVNNRRNYIPLYKSLLKKLRKLSGVES
jgi:hypothetical protein